MNERTHAIVLGGGGISGIAWEAALLAGLIDAGLPVEEADAFGTSAGSVVATLLLSGHLRPEALGSLMQMSMEPEGDHGHEAMAFDSLAFIDLKATLAVDAHDEQETRRRLGAHALANPVSAPEDVWVASIGALVPTDWPARRLGVTAVDASDGSFRVFEQADGVPLVQAVAASCTVPTVYPLVTIDGRPYMDGGMRSSTNADVAAGYDKVLVVSCGPEAPSSPYGPTLDQALVELRRESDVLLVEPDAATLEVFARNVLDPAHREPAAMAGWAQAQALAAEITAFWQ